MTFFYVCVCEISKLTEKFPADQSQRAVVLIASALLDQLRRTHESFTDTDQ